MHSHLIPGIDDGSKSLKESLHLIERLAGLGYKKIITTPHIMGEYYPNTPEIIRAGLKEVKAALAKTDLNITLEAAAEYYIDDYFEQLLNDNKELLTFSDNRLLIEFSTLTRPDNLFEIIFQLNTRGYRLILAHPERYLYFADQFDVFEKIKSMGCDMQANLLSLAGHYGREQKKLGIKLLKAGMIDYLGTDLHRASHLEKINAINKDRLVRKLIKNTAFQNQFL